MRHDKHSIIKIGRSTDWYFVCIHMEIFFQNIEPICRKNCIKNIFYDFFVKKLPIYTNFSSLQLWFFYCFYYLIIESISFQIHLYFFYNDYSKIYFSTHIFIKCFLCVTWDGRLSRCFLYSIALIGDWANTIIATLWVILFIEKMWYLVF